jgi:phosphonopyruvate decarboxylase
MAGNMGGALSLGVGASMTGKKVIVCGGDGEFVMHMGGLSTAGRYKYELDLTYILFDNEQNKSTGGQNTYQSHLKYIDIAKACGFNIEAKTITKLDEFSKIINEQKTNKGLKFILVKCNLDDETPRPPLKVVKVNKFN